jgi:gluconokinase
MGVSGVGKSTVACELAALLDLDSADGDDFHEPASITAMADGTPLTDGGRMTWLQAVGTWLAAHETAGGVVSCSALKRTYRDLLVAAAPRTTFLHLVADHAVVRDRMEGRDHFMPPSLLDSQERLLEPLQDDEPGWTIRADRAPVEIAREFVDLAGLAGHT